MTKTTGQRPPNDATLRKWRRFAQEYIFDLNGTEAAIRAGYSASRAKQTASDLLHRPEVQQMIREEMKSRERRTAVNADRVVNELARIGFANVRDLLNDDGTLKALEDLPTEVAAAVSSIKRATDGSVEIKLWSKTTALDGLMKHLDLYGPERHEHSGPGGGPIPTEEFSNLSDQERAHRITALLDRARARLDGQADDGGGADLAAPGGAADGGGEEPG